ncbi:SDR family NAD(P)-dependent oxidoreductase [Xanthomonas euvesicatoria pv. allii]|uniref:SDR family NAD(P)-dependent oxidoreductase n=1 Tax=Xanthomonas euvesicatoria TaxID=456327 RepID=UPI002404E63A|nr:SDR family NAD(P)-dependent oxidoreductase [Xanthomonas euvesicatoria]MCP3041333.1 SDR family NAD(P)-dependent oxidoreductase [Xanthomonas euvesicatoria pv. allii]MCP3053416.1 SDR family NAD(P)-dependent oxidoreductase [Xanthomonas euvesicatoria pv. allii]
MNTASQKTWFITGASRGLGRVWAEAALNRGDRVVATARDTSSMSTLAGEFGDQLLLLVLDVRQRPAVQAAIDAASAHFGQLDVVINNAGYGLFGMVEEVSEDQARDQFETNFFGALWVTQAVIPYMRAQSGGHIIQISSIGGVTAFPMFGIYNASKWALEGMSQALHDEVRSFGIKVTLVEPTAFATDWAHSSAVHATPNAQYSEARREVARMWGSQALGKPEASATALLELVDACDPPLRVFFGDLLPLVQAEYSRRLGEWKNWEQLACSAMGGQG